MGTVQKLKTEVANRPKITSVWDFFEARKAEIAKVLPDKVTPDRLIGVLSFMIKGNSQIANASANSLIAAVIQSAQQGLDPALGECYFVPFVNKGVKEVQYIIGYKGMVELMNRSKKAALLSTECVYEHDHFKYALGLNPILEHVPYEGPRGEFKGVYAIAANLVANEKVFVYLSKEDVDKVRASSKAGKSEYSPWAKWYDEMAKKTAIRRLCKLLPLSVEEQRIIASDETTKRDIAIDMTQVPDVTNYDDPEPALEVTAQASEAGTTMADEPICPKCQEVTCECEEQKQPITDAQRKRLFAICNEKNISDTAFKAYLKETFGITSRKDITQGMYVDINLWLQGADNANLPTQGENHS